MRFKDLVCQPRGPLAKTWGTMILSEFYRANQSSNKGSCMAEKKTTPQKNAKKEPTRTLKEKKALKQEKKKNK